MPVSLLSHLFDALWGHPSSHVSLDSHRSKRVIGQLINRLNVVHNASVLNIVRLIRMSNGTQWNADGNRFTGNGVTEFFVENVL